MTATPRNKSVWDIYNQLRLFHQDDVTDLPVDPPNLRQYFRLVEEGERRLPALLAHLLIRRTRAHVLRWYGYDEETGQRVDPDRFAPYRKGRRRAYVLVGRQKQFFPELRQITVLEAAFRRPNLRPAVRSELNRLRREGIAGEALLGTLSNVYHVYGLDEVRRQRDVSEDENDALPRTVCSEALIE